MNPISHDTNLPLPASSGATRAVGKVSHIDPVKGRGVIQTEQGVAVYFSAHDVIHGNFFEFEPGDGVRAEFHASLSSHAWALSVAPLSKHHLTE